MSNLLDNIIKEVFANLSGLTLIITVGNDMRGDDGVGPYIASHIRETNCLKIIDAKSKPENIIDDACSINPGKIIIIDAADFKGKSGEIRVIPEELIPQTTVSTHAIPLSVISKILKSDIGCDVVFIGIQTENVTFGEGLTDCVKASADQFIKVINSKF